MATTFLEPGTDATQDLSFFPVSATTNGTIASDSAQSHTGLRSIKSDVTVAGSTSLALVRTADGTVADTGAAVSVWVMLSTVGPATNLMFLGPIQATATSNNAIIGVGVTTGGVLRICGRGCTAVDGTTALVANTWFRVTLTWVITTSSNWSAKLYLNGTLEASTSNADGTLGSVTSSRVWFGCNGSSSVDTFGTTPIATVWFDDAYIDNRTSNLDTGDIRVTAKRPFSNGAANQFITQIGSGGSGYGTGHAPQVNEQPLSATNGWSLSNTTVQTEEYTIEGPSVGDVDIGAAAIVDYIGWIRAQVNSVANSPVHHIIVGGTSTLKTMTTSAATYTQAAASTSYPAGSTDIGMDAAYTTTPHLTSLFECGILVAYALTKFPPFPAVQQTVYRM